MKKKIILVCGDPNSINSEIIYKALKKIKKSIKNKVYLISNYELMKKQFKALKYKIKLQQVTSINQETKSDKLKIFDMKLKFKKPFKVKKNEASKYIFKSLDYAHKLALSAEVGALINCPISKKLLKKKEFGVTEYLARKNKIIDKSETMLIRNNKLAVCPITTHSDLKNVSKKISTELIFNKVKKISDWYKICFKKKPKIAILGLNPHNAELKKNCEEIRIIIPAIKKLKKINLKVDGPFAADTIFINDYKKFDVIIGMYHDQVLTPFKTLFKFNAINLTLGLKYMRLSPDHGTAYNLIKKNKASSESLEECLKFVSNNII